jgi:hypothetical protein
MNVLARAMHLPTYRHWLTVCFLLQALISLHEVALACHPLPHQRDPPLHRAHAHYLSWTDKLATDPDICLLLQALMCTVLPELADLIYQMLMSPNSMS